LHQANTWLEDCKHHNILLTMIANIIYPRLVVFGTEVLALLYLEPR